VQETEKGLWSKVGPGINVRLSFKKTPKKGKRAVGYDSGGRIPTYQYHQISNKQTNKKITVKLSSVIHRALRNNTLLQFQ
jgi:hypothetical protein